MSNPETASAGSGALPTAQTSDGSLRSEVPLLLSILAAVCLGWVSVSVMPLIADTMINDFGISASQAGLLISFETSAMAICCLLVVPMIGRVPLLRILLFGALLSACGHFASSFFQDFSSLVLPRVLAGAGEGFCLACGYGAIVESKHPERATGLLTVGFGLIGAVQIALFPLATQFLGESGVFIMLALMCVVLLAGVRNLPSLVGREAAATETVSATTTAEANTTSNSHSNRYAIFGVMLAIITMYTAHSAFWPFTKEIAMSASLPEASVGLTLGVYQAFGIVGGLMAGIIGMRYGRKRPLFGSLAIYGVTLSLSVLADQLILFVLVFFLNSIMYYYVVPYMKGTLVLFDKTGRAIAASTTVTLGGLAIGPALGGYFVEHYGLDSIAYLTLPLIGFTFLMMVWVVSRIKGGAV